MALADEGRDPIGTVDAREAAALLGVKPATLYAYVSRGLLASHAGPGGRARCYRRADIERLRARREGSASSALRWGEPVLESSITAMTSEGPRYRDRPALDLAREGVAFERVAELLWAGSLPERAPRFAAGIGEAALAGLRSRLPDGAPPVAWQTLVVASLAPHDAARFDTAPAAVLPRARAAVRWLVAGLALWSDPRRLPAALDAPSVAAALAAALGIRASTPVRRALDRWLVLLADHELNASTFAARVAASAHADPHACVLAGLAALSGPRHGGASDRVEALLAAVPDAGRAGAVLRERERLGEPVPGFGHPFYPAGDPRAALLLETCRGLGPRRGGAAARTLDAVVDAMAAAGRPPPNVDVAAVRLRLALGLPRGAAAGLFAVARCAGWMAHVLEQYETGHLLRPRARYRAWGPLVAAPGTGPTPAHAGGADG